MEPDPVVVLVPAKPGSLAKGRLRADLGPGRAAWAQTLASAMALDVVAAAVAAPVARVVLVTADGELARLAGAAGAHALLGAAPAGLNADLRCAARAVRTELPTAGLIVLPADCPCITPRDVRALALLARTAGRAWCVPDGSGHGTTALVVPAGASFAPAYGPGSRAAHEAAGARSLVGARWRRLGRDVDVGADLLQARRLGVGPRTAAVLRAAGGPSGRPV